ncbi:MAG: DEAD/DEAH box helicase [Candidatus Thiodiazotropha sp.]
MKKRAEGPNDNQVPFGDHERLLIHQLRLLEWLETRAGKRQNQNSDSAAEEQPLSVPEKWKLTRNVTLYDWQKECIARWFENGFRGTVKVVTGGGKTLLALAITEKLQNEEVPGLRLAIVVPTIVLMHQWYDELLERGNLPAEVIARMGGGYQEEFSDDKRVLISVLASAHRQLPKLVRKAGVENSLLLVADECHRAGATEMSHVFKTERAFNLGLSATPERDEDTEQDEDAGYDESLLGKELGPIIYDFKLIDALKLGVVPSYTILHYGLVLSTQEKARYERLSRTISDSQSELRNRAPADKASGAAFFQWARAVSSRSRGEVGTLASRLMADISRRKALLYGMEGRGNAVQTLLQREFDANPDARVILFHESIDEVMKLFLRLRDAGFPVIAEHSELPGSVREAGLDLFRKGIAQVIVSARSLIEGFNVPAVDMAIIVASSASVRQRVQSLGRVLRRHRSKSGEEKTSVIHVLYARDTVDDAIYGKFDWDQTTGIERNLYFHWDGLGEPSPQAGPPRYPLPTEEQIDDSLLQEGSEYPGAYEGAEYSCDTRGNVKDSNGAQVRNPSALPELVSKAKGSAGRFRVTKRKKYVLVRVPRGDDWGTIFVTRLKVDFDVGADEEVDDIDEGAIRIWAESASPGDDYPYGGVPIIDESLRFRSKRGGVIARKVSGGEVFARTGERAIDPEKGADAVLVIEAIRKLHSTGTRISQLEMNKLNHVLYRVGGRLFFVCVLRNGLEFPD